MSTFLSAASLILGGLSWIAPILAVAKYSNTPHKNHSQVHLISFGFCLGALCIQFFDIHHQLLLQNWSSLMDTMGTLRWIAAILSIITILLNIAVFLLCREKNTGRS